MKKIKNLKKYRKQIIIGSAVLASTLSVIGISVVKENRAEAAALEEALNESAAIVDDIYSNVFALYTDESFTFLSEEATLEMVTANETAIAEAEALEEMDEETAAKLEVAKTENANAKEMIALRDATNALFNADGTLADNADIAGAQAKADALKDIKPEFVAEMQKLIDKANDLKKKAEEEAKAKEAEAAKQAEEEEQVSHYEETSNNSSSNSSSSNNPSSSGGSGGSSSKPENDRTCGCTGEFHDHYVKADHNGDGVIKEIPMGYIITSGPERSVGMCFEEEGDIGVIMEQCFPGEPYTYEEFFMYE